MDDNGLLCRERKNLLKNLGKMMMKNPRARPHYPPAVAAAVGFEGKEKQAELEAIAQQAGSDSEQLCKALQPHFPDIDLPRELDAFHKWMRKHDKRATPRGFVRWLLRCEPAIKPLPRRSGSANGAKPPPKPQPPGWEAWLTSHYPDAKTRDYWCVPYEDGKREFRQFQSNQKPSTP
jgi:hypothetical protein